MKPQEPPSNRRPPASREELRQRGKTRQLPYPWPFRESIVPGRGLVRNFPATEPSNKPLPEGPPNVGKHRA